MPTKAATVKTVKAALKNLKKDFERQHENEANRVASDLAEEGVFLLNKTLQGQGLGPGGGFAGATPAKDYKIIRTSKGAMFELRLVMSDGGGIDSPHFVWHLIQFGIPARTQKKSSPPIPIKTARTQPNVYPVSAQPVQVDQYVVIPKGTPISAVEARNWYELIGSNLERILRNNHPGWELRSTKVNKP